MYPLLNLAGETGSLCSFTAACSALMPVRVLASPNLRLRPALPSYRRTQSSIPIKQKDPRQAWVFLFGRGDRTRTCDTRFWRPVLYQLSYSPMEWNTLIIRYSACFVTPCGSEHTVAALHARPPPDDPCNNMPFMLKYALRNGNVTKRVTSSQGHKTD